MDPLEAWTELLQSYRAFSHYVDSGCCVLTTPSSVRLIWEFETNFVRDKLLRFKSDHLVDYSGDRTPIITHILEYDYVRAWESVEASIPNKFSERFDTSLNHALQRILTISIVPGLLLGVAPPVIFGSEISRVMADTDPTLFTLCMPKPPYKIDLTMNDSLNLIIGVSYADEMFSELQMVFDELTPLLDESTMTRILQTEAVQKLFHEPPVRTMTCRPRID